MALNNKLVYTCILLTVAFRMYDLDGNNMIAREELLAVLHMMVGANISEEQVRNHGNNVEKACQVQICPFSNCHIHECSIK